MGRKTRPVPPSRARAKIESLERHIHRCDQITGFLERNTNRDIQLSIDQALRGLADTRRWLTDAIECIRIDNGITASGEALIEKVST